MCKIDFLGTGLCPAVKNRHYVSYYPQGRMDIYAALAHNSIPVTERLVDIAETCNLCGICEKQCYFVTELRPMKVMKALKDRVASHLRNKKDVFHPECDEILKQFQKIVGEDWASNDPAILISYAHDPGPLTGIQKPRYVVLPRNTAEISKIVKTCNDHDIPYNVRGNGSSVMGLVMSPEGLVLDLVRMKDIRIDQDNWAASVEPGVSAFELQREAAKSGMRASLAEPAALVCANIMCSGIFSTYSNAYGTAADNYVNAEFVGPDGEIFSLNRRDAPNLFSFRLQEMPSPGICTRVDIKLHPKTEDEQGLLVPFSDFASAADFSRELSQRRIGLALAVLGMEYVSVFISPTLEIAHKAKHLLQHVLGMQYAVLVIGDRYSLDAVQRMAPQVLDSEILETLILGVPQLLKGEWRSLIEAYEGEEKPYAILLRKENLPVLEAALKPSPATVAGTVVEDLQSFYEELYSRPEMTDLVWLNDFRIISSRMGREKHVVAFIVYVPLDKLKIIEEIISEFRRIGEKSMIKHDYGFLTPLELGKRAVLEYDYYHDHTDPAQIKIMQSAVVETAEMLAKYSLSIPGVMWIKFIFNQGFARKESFLYT
jgi:hypothetical protein